MARLSTLSNPTGLKDLDKGVVGLMLQEGEGLASYSLSSLDLEQIALPSNTRVIVVARRGNAELRVEHGAIAEWNKKFVDISELGSDGVWSFRVLFVEPESPKLIAVIENVRPNGLGSSESLIGMESADLGQVPWELQIMEQEGRAVILFNKDIYPTVGSAADDVKFWALVLPEAVRGLAKFHADAPERIQDSQWEPFRKWLALIGIEDELDEEFSEEERASWCKGVVSAFCEWCQAAHMLAEMINNKGDL